MKKGILKKALEFIAGSFPGDGQVEEAAQFLLEKSEELQLEDDSPPSGNLEAFPLPIEIVEVGGFALFSDGSCRGNPGPGAWGMMGQNSKGEVVFQASGVDTTTTNNRMEIEGAIKAIEAFKEHLQEFPENPYPKAVLFSDSKYVVDGMTSWIDAWKRRGWKKADKKAPDNLDLWQNLDRVASGVDALEFRWVKGHSGHPQNEFVDQLANCALDEAGY